MSNNVVDCHCFKILLLLFVGCCWVGFIVLKLLSRKFGRGFRIQLHTFIRRVYSQCLCLPTY